jgi:hypothetical protein
VVYGVNKDYTVYYRDGILPGIISSWSGLEVEKTYGLPV